MSTETTEPTLTRDEIDALPLDERIMIALADAGLDESDVETALGVVVPMIAADMRALADEVEWKHRSMTFHRGGCGSTTRLHPAGATIRAHVQTFAPAPAEVSR